MTQSASKVKTLTLALSQMHKLSFLVQSKTSCFTPT